jgi:hypothetical protein
LKIFRDYLNALYFEGKGPMMDLLDHTWAELFDLRDPILPYLNELIERLEQMQSYVDHRSIIKEESVYSEEHGTYFSHYRKEPRITIKSIPKNLLEDYEFVRKPKRLVKIYEGDKKVFNSWKDEFEIEVIPKFIVNLQKSILLSFYRISHDFETMNSSFVYEKRNIEFVEKGVHLFYYIREEPRSIDDIIQDILSQVKSRFSYVLEFNVQMIDREQAETAMMDGIIYKDFQDAMGNIYGGFGPLGYPLEEGHFLWREGGPILKKIHKFETRTIQDEIEKEIRKPGRPKTQKYVLRGLLRETFNHMERKGIIARKSQKSRLYSLTEYGEELTKTDILKISPMKARELDIKDIPSLITVEPRLEINLKKLMVD